MRARIRRAEVRAAQQAQEAMRQAEIAVLFVQVAKEITDVPSPVDEAASCNSTLATPLAWTSHASLKRGNEP